MECHYSKQFKSEKMLLIHFIDIPDNKKINVVTTHPLVLTCIEKILTFMAIIQSIYNQLYKVNVQFQKLRCF